MIMESGQTDDRKVDLTIGFPGFCNAEVKLSVWVELVFGFCDVLSRSGVYLYLSLPPAHHCQEAPPATRNVSRLFDWLHAQRSSVKFIDLMFWLVDANCTSCTTAARHALI